MSLASSRREWVAGAALIVALTVAFSLPVQAQQKVGFDSLDRSGGQAVRLIGFWFPVAQVKAGAVLLLHGCGGPYARDGELATRMRDHAALLNAQGLHVLVTDSLTPRGETELCTQRIGQRQVTQANRRLDALAAVEWLAQRPDVDAARIGLVGWSNGGSNVLSAINAMHPAVATAAHHPSFAVAFYPGCESDLKRGFETRTPLLMLVGESDDWTPAAPCHALAQAAVIAPGSADVAPRIVGYAGAYHGFDSTSPVRLRRDVPNGVHPGQGVHVGGEPQARGASRAALLSFIADPLKH